MKLIIPIISALIGALSSASATTITLAGGTAGRQFQTSTGVILSPSNATLQVGSFEGGIFTQFATTDTSQPTFSTVAALLGRWTGNASINGALAAPFNGLQLWYQVQVYESVTLGVGNGLLGSVLFTQAGSNFPADGNGLGDTVSKTSLDFTTFSNSLYSGSALVADPDGAGPGLALAVVGVVPEPSAALLGALGIFGLLRRRR